MLLVLPSTVSQNTDYSNIKKKVLLKDHKFNKLKFRHTHEMFKYIIFMAILRAQNEYLSSCAGLTWFDPNFSNLERPVNSNYFGLEAFIRIMHTPLTSII